MFRGNNPAKVDEKGRLKIPAEFRHGFDERGDIRFFITSRDGKRAEIHAMQDWEAIELKLAEIPDMNPAKKKLMDRVNYFGHTSEIDTQARVLIPQILRDKAKLTGDVLVIGKGKYLEVANREEYEREMEENELTVDDARELASLKL
ncbi:division/cell wall cluster transcriptional repressor MraZ [Paracidobacterium acidisoli]|uniref:Transcriptional regulator MraZ n=1 Tax=Paracidobacterium acidisoli TaxID=2303751 RepID=A0A372ILA6_9BACT|nr:division/cell wall cluster transcriptional repressor MraZ [Paracidobacterium acidisoli]MBT9332939.1 division/cell wall cluster transcriptional repressor MraZ [Paracidobacterium acidisoli]